MDKKFCGNSNGERDIRSTAEETQETATFRGGGSQSQPPQMQSSSQFHQPESSHQRVNGFMNGDFDLQTLESSFGSLSLAESSFRQSGNPILQNRYNQVINGGGSGGCGGGGDWYMYYRLSNQLLLQRELEEMQRFYQMQQRVSVQNDCVNRSYGYDTNGGMLNNGSLNGVSYSTRNHVSDHKPWDYSNGFGNGMTNNSWRGNEGFGYNHNHDQGLSMENGRGSLILSMATDRVSKEQVEKSILEGSKETVDMIFDGLIDHICDLMMDPFGNDVVLELMKKCSSEQIIQIVDMVTQYQSRFVNTCFDPLGTNAIQLLLWQIKIRCEEDQILRIVAEITMVALRLTRSTNANDVILTCFSVFTFSQCRDLLEVVVRFLYQIAIDQHGCCMLQQCFNKERIINHEIKQRLIRGIITHALKLCLNCYGNYVVQYVVELDNQHVTEALVRQLLGSYAHLARNKYGSHAVQKLLKLRGIDSWLIVQDLLSEIDTLLLDPFGNYVIQTAWFVSKDDVRQRLRWHIQRNIRLMRCNKFGNKILEKLDL